MSDAKIAAENNMTSFNLAIVSQNSLKKQAFTQACLLLTAKLPTIKVNLVAELAQSATSARSISVLALDYAQLNSSTNVSRETFKQQLLSLFQANSWKTCFILQVLPLDIFIQNVDLANLNLQLSAFFKANQASSMLNASASDNAKVADKSESTRTAEIISNSAIEATETTGATETAKVVETAKFSPVHRASLLNCKSDLARNEHLELREMLAKFVHTEPLNVLYFGNCFCLTLGNLSFSIHRSPYLLDLWPKSNSKDENSVSRAKYKLLELADRLANSEQAAELDKEKEHNLASFLCKQADETQLESIRTQYKQLPKNIYQTIKIWQTAPHLAFDLGAAPGGWTEVLLNYNYQVIAIDPQHLKITAKANLWHFQALSDQFLEMAKANNFALAKANLLVNDMKMFFRPSLALAAEFLPYLTNDAIIIQTIKLSKTESYFKQIKDIKRYLEHALPKCKLEFVRQLSVNRSELTLVLSKITG